MPTSLRRLRGLAVPLLFAPLLGVLLFAKTAAPAQAQLRDIAYTFEPSVQTAFEAEDAAFTDGTLFGGALGLGFGRYFEVSGEYLVNAGLSNDFSNIDELGGLLPRDLGVQRGGGRLRLNFYDRRVLPFVTAGAGVLRFDAESAEPASTIYGLAGAGVTVVVRRRYRFSLSGEVLSYRYDPTTTFLGPTAPGDLDRGARLVRSPALTASVSLFLGGRDLDAPTLVDRALQEQFGGGLGGLRLFVEPFYGRLEFNEAVGFPKDQNVAGVNAGVELGPYIGLRGFYWRGTTGENAFDEFGRGLEDIQLYGSELRLRLNLEFARGFVPYALLGGGYLDVGSDYDDDLPPGTVTPGDRFFATSGLGLEIPLTDAIKISGGTRALWSDAGTPAPTRTRATDPARSVYASLMYTAGLEVRLGGGGGRDRDDARRPRDRDRPRPRDPLPRRRRTDDVLITRADSLSEAVRALREGDPRGSNVSGQVVVLPVPEVGEIYVRFGPAGASATARDTVFTDGRGRRLTEAERIERAVQQAVRARLAQDADSTGLSAEAVERIVERTVRDAVGARPAAAGDDTRELDRMQREIEALRRQLRDRDGAPPAEGAEGEPQTPFYREVAGRPLTFLVPVTGVRVGEGPTQVQFGVRADYRRTAASRLHILPEFTVGIGGGVTSLGFLANGAFEFARDITPRTLGVPISPYTGLGVGVLSDGGLSFEPVLNLLFGVTYDINPRHVIFAEVSTLDFLDTNRLTIGYRFGL